MPVAWQKWKLCGESFSEPEKKVTSISAKPQNPINYVGMLSGCIDYFKHFLLSKKIKLEGPCYMCGQKKTEKEVNKAILQS
jgi:hypothetical protein